MRITTLQTTNSMLDYITTAQSKYYDLSQQASSGLKITRPSDDPAATKGILNANTKLSELQTYLSNMKTASSELATTDSTLDALTGLIQDASDYATQAANGTYNEKDLATIKSQIDSIIESVVDLANTQFNGTYIFSGTATASEAYTIDTATGSILYNGTDTTEYQRYVSISDGVSVGINADGDSVFGSYDNTAPPAVATGLFGTLKNLSNALGTNPQTAASKAVINSSITTLGNNMDTVTAARTKLAGVSNRFEMTSDSINQTIVNLKSFRSGLQDADLAEVLTELATSQSALEATYSITSKMLSSTSLLDYL